MKDKIKSYGFWVSLSGAIVVLVDTICKAIGVASYGNLVSNIIMGIAGVLVVFGIVSMPSNNNATEKQSDDEDNTLNLNE